jgi:hypothetical protein
MKPLERKSFMAESKYAKMLSAINPQSEPAQPFTINMPQKPARPPGKRSDPAYTQRSHFMRDDLFKAATKKLSKRDDGADMSDLLNFLLEQYVNAAD